MPMKKGDLRKSWKEEAMYWNRRYKELQRKPASNVTEQLKDEALKKGAEARSNIDNQNITGSPSMNVDVTPSPVTEPQIKPVAYTEPPKTEKESPDTINKETGDLEASELNIEDELRVEEPEKSYKYQCQGCDAYFNDLDGEACPNCKKEDVDVLELEDGSN